MRGNLTDQDLTDYALNELDPGQRLYVESMLAVSVECRNDVYEMLDLAQMLEEGFDRDGGRTVVATLTPEQRTRLTKPRRRRAAFAFVNKAVATLAAAACVAFAIANPQLWRDNENVRKVAQVLPTVEDTDLSPYVGIDALSDDTSDWLKAASDALPEPAVICTPPSWLENSDLSNLH